MVDLKQIAMQLPEVNKRAAEQANAANAVRLQQAVAVAPVGTPVLPVAQGIQQQYQQQQQQVAQAAQQQTAQGLQQVAELGQQGQQQQQQLLEQSRKLQLNDQQELALKKLDSVDSSLRRQLVARQLELANTQSGQVLLNERQLADWRLATAQNKQQLLDYQQTVQQLQDRQYQTMKRAHDLLVQRLEQEATKSEREQDQQLKLELGRKAQALEEQLQRDKARATSRAAIAQGVFSVAGAVAGGILGASTGNPMLAAAGASTGASVGAASAPLLMSAGESIKDRLRGV